MDMNGKNIAGKNMTGNTKFLILALLLLVALSFFLGHFWNCAVWALQKAVATGVTPPHAITFVEGIVPLHVLI